MVGLGIGHCLVGRCGQRLQDRRAKMLNMRRFYHRLMVASDVDDTKTLACQLLPGKQLRVNGFAILSSHTRWRSVAAALRPLRGAKHREWSWNWQQGVAGKRFLGRPVDCQMAPQDIFIDIAG